MSQLVDRRPRTWARNMGAMALAVPLVIAVGLVAATVPGSAAHAATGEDSEVTVAWAGGNDADIQQYQPDHAALEGNGSGHWDDFKDVEVTVSQTRGLIDQVVTVTATGLAPTQLDYNRSGGARSFFQVFQCWGDPQGADFARTCQWGGFSSAEVGGSVLRSVSNLFGPGVNDVVGRGLEFRAVTGQENETVTIPNAGSNNGLGAFFTASTSNEQVFVPVGGDGHAQVDFQVQSAAAQPYLGCGDPDAAGSRCWLVVVPRGTHSGSLADGTMCVGAALGGGTYGGTTDSQRGTPISPRCSFWEDRIVVPLDFEDPYQTCPAGSAERRVVGSELIADAVSSWQSQLCSGDDGAAFALTTNTGDLSRAQLLNGQVDLVAVARPLTVDSIGSADPRLLDTADLRYAPLANTALTIGYVAESTSVVYRDLRLTPRLVAKLLTQSYRGEIPEQYASSSPTVGDSLAVVKNNSIISDPEWAALGNPTNFNGQNGLWVVSGPQGDDAIRLLWEYVQADADAVAFLSGEPDPWGATVNPYYLPAGHPNAAGGGLDVDLAHDPVDSLLKADQSVFPSRAVADANYRGMQVDSITYSPYSSSLTAVASRVARVDNQVTNEWDPNKFSGANVGFWADAVGPKLPMSGRLILGATTASAAENYGLTVAQLALPLSQATDKTTVVTAREFVAYSSESVSAAVAAETGGGDGVASLDLTTLPDGAYPLTTTIYAATNLGPDGPDQDARNEYAHLLEYAAGEGNVVSGQRGGLPEGYVPLTESQIAATQVLATALTASRADGPAPTSVTIASSPRNGAADPEGVRSATSTAPRESTLGGAPASQTRQSAASGEAASTTAAATSPSQAALGGALAVSAAGLIASPFLLRRKGMGG